MLLPCARVTMKMWNIPEGHDILWPGKSARPLRSQTVSESKSSVPKPRIEELERRNLLSKATFAVASGILNSPENFINFVTSEYRHLLGRNPDSNGLNHFVGLLENGVNPETIEAQLASSTEYILDHGNAATGFITGLYQDLLARNPDNNGLNNWLNALANGSSNFAVAAGFVTSRERDV